MIFLGHARLPALACAIGLGIAYALSAAWPSRYTATARVILPAGAGPGSRIVKIEHQAADPQAAASAVHERLAIFIRRKGEVLDAPLVLAQRPSLPLNLAIGGAAGLMLGAGLMIGRQRRRQPVRNERELVNALGEPLLAEARKHFRVVLIDTPAAARGPDFQMFAALDRSAARLVTTIIHQA